MVICFSSSCSSFPSKDPFPSEDQAADPEYSDSSYATNKKLKIMTRSRRDGKIHEQMKFPTGALPSSSDRRLHRNRGSHHTQQFPVKRARRGSGKGRFSQIQQNHRRMLRRNSFVIPRSAAQSFFASLHLDEDNEVQPVLGTSPTPASETLTKATVAEPVEESEGDHAAAYFSSLPPVESSSPRATISTSSLLSFCACPFEEERPVDFENEDEHVGTEDGRA